MTSSGKQPTRHVTSVWVLDLSLKGLSDIFLKRTSFVSLKEGSQRSSWSPGFHWEEHFVLQMPLGFGHPRLKRPCLPGQRAISIFQIPKVARLSAVGKWICSTPPPLLLYPNDERDIGSLGSVCASTAPVQLRERIEMQNQDEDRAHHPGMARVSHV